MFNKLDPNGCQTWVYDERGYPSQCQLKPKTTRNGELYCTIHDPEYVAAKRKTQQEKWDNQIKVNMVCWELDFARRNATAGLTVEELKQVTPDEIRKLITERDYQVARTEILRWR